MEDQTWGGGKGGGKRADGALTIRLFTILGLLDGADTQVASPPGHFHIGRSILGVTVTPFCVERRAVGSMIVILAEARGVTELASVVAVRVLALRDG